MIESQQRYYFYLKREGFLMLNLYSPLIACFFLVGPAFIPLAIGSEKNEEKITLTKQFRQVFNIAYDDRLSHISLTTLEKILAIPVCPASTPGKNLNLRKFAIFTGENCPMVCQYTSLSINKVTDIGSGTFRLTNREGDSIYNATIFKFAFEPKDQDHKAQETKTFSISVMKSTPEIENDLKNKLIPTLKFENILYPSVQAKAAPINYSSSPAPRLPKKAVNFEGLSSPLQATSTNAVPKGLGPLKGVLKTPSLPSHVPISSPKKLMDASSPNRNANLNAQPKHAITPPPVPPRPKIPKK